MNSAVLHIVAAGWRRRRRTDNLINLHQKTEHVRLSSWDLSSLFSKISVGKSTDTSLQLNAAQPSWEYKWHFRIPSVVKSTFDANLDVLLLFNDAKKCNGSKQASKIWLLFFFCMHWYYIAPRGRGSGWVSHVSVCYDASHALHRFHHHAPT